MRDIELRFVERDEREQVETYVAIVRKRQVLQYRKRYPLVGDIVWTAWHDVPMEIEEK